MTTPTPRQVVAARALLGIRQAELAERAKVSVVTVRGYETSRTNPRPATLAKITRALTRMGIIFLDGDGGTSLGVRLRTRTRPSRTELTAPLAQVAA